MKKGIFTFIAGMLVMVILLVMFVPALAESTLQTIEVGINTVDVKLDGSIVASKGINYVREGTEGEVPTAINYQGTVYMPLRRIAEMLDINVDYDSNTKTVILTTNNYKLGKDTTITMNDANISTQEKTINPNDYSDWSTEEESAYQDFKSMWSATSSTPYITQLVEFAYIGSISKDEFIKYWNNLDDSTQKSYVFRLMMEYVDEKVPNGTCYVEMNGSFLWNAYWMRGNIYSISTGLITKTY